MKTRLRLAGALVALGFGIALAHAQAPAARSTETRFAEQVRLFTDACVRAFPDEPVAGSLAQAGRYRAMTPDQVRAYLQRDSGRGWFLRTPLGSYAITVEDPPVRTCAVRRMTPAGIANAEAFAKLISDDAARRHLDVTKLPVQSAKTRDGADVIALPYALLPPGAKDASEIYMLLLTNYHGQYRSRLLDGAVGGDGVEIRLVRQIPPSSLQRS